MDLGGKLVTIQRADALIAAITARNDGRLRVAVFRPLDAKSAEYLIGLGQVPHPEHGVCMRENNWEYALDCSAGNGNYYAADRGEAYLSYWEKGLGISWDGTDVPEWRKQLDLVARPVARVVAELGIHYPLSGNEDEEDRSLELQDWRSFWASNIPDKQRPLGSHLHDTGTFFCAKLVVVGCHGGTLSGCCTWFLRPPNIKIVTGYCRCKLNVAAWGAVPHCHHHGYTLSPQGDHIVATILATHSTHCSHKAATLLPACRHTVHTVSRQPDLIAQIIFAGHKAPCPVTPSPGHKISNNSQGIWNLRCATLECT